MIEVKNIIKLDEGFYGCDIKPEGEDEFIKDVILDITDEGKHDSIESYPEEHRDSYLYAMYRIMKSLKYDIALPDHFQGNWYKFKRKKEDPDTN